MCVEGARLRLHCRNPAILRVDSVALKIYLPVGSGITDHTETFGAKTMSANDPHDMPARLYYRFREAERNEG